MEGTKKRTRFKGAALAAVAALLAAAWLFAAVGGVRRGSGDKGREQLELALRRAAVAYYAQEGVYPPTVDHLVEHYGIQIGDAYTVHYDVFASNLMPDITVLEKDMQ